MNEEQMIAMRIGDYFYIPKTSIHVLRVPAGWIYTVYNNMHTIAQTYTFVPEPIYEDEQPTVDDLK